MGSNKRHVIASTHMRRHNTRVDQATDTDLPFCQGDESRYKATPPLSATGRAGVGCRVGLGLVVGTGVATLPWHSAKEGSVTLASLASVRVWIEKEREREIESGSVS